MKITTKTIDNLCIIPVVGSVIGAGTVVSNLIKAIQDIAKITIGTYKAKDFLQQRKNSNSIEATSINEIKNQSSLSADKRAFFEHITFIAIGLLRMIPVIGGLIRSYQQTLAYNQNILGEKYEEGIDGFEQSHKKAFDYFTEAANFGNKDAQANLGYFYLHGCKINKIEPNKIIAFEWFAKAADQGHKDAQELLEIKAQSKLAAKQKAEQAAEREAQKDKIQLERQRCLNERGLLTPLD